MKLRRVGNTLIVTIPKRVAEAMGWDEGDEVQVQVAGRDALRISKVDEENDQPNRRIIWIVLPLT